eukprot:TRINITY_DN2965_c0_g1_i1.p1 TRINITY_DN2965_c0_g1~~TRINITY_DN2965_c0_g1_i1.p1  ORF type:complete len:392 (+),score=47.47 TRINITY_DN2965_c0_g1_i1:256-1431(+)
MPFDTRLFTGDVNPDLICDICLNVQEDPVMVCEEGHSACRVCIGKWMARSRDPVCPQCRRAICTGDAASLTRARLANNLIQELTVRCPTTIAEDEGAAAAPVGSAGEETARCRWTGRCAELTAHAAECRAEEVSCPHAGCTDHMRRGQQQVHAAMCPHRPASCPHCGKTMPFRGVTGHAWECPERPSPCLNACGVADMPYWAIENHRATTCAEEPVPCTFAPWGCDARPTRRGLQAHEQSHMAYHLALAVRRDEARDADVPLRRQQGRAQTAAQSDGARDARLQQLETTVQEVARRDAERDAELRRLRLRVEAAARREVERDEKLRQLENMVQKAARRDARRDTVRDAAWHAQQQPWNSSGPPAFGVVGFGAGVHGVYHAVPMPRAASVGR